MKYDTESLISMLSNLRIDALNDMQLAAAEAGSADTDVVLLSPTGSGKTIAFLLPLVQSMDAGNKFTQAMVIAPSRELALQIEKVFKQMGTGLKVTCCYGGHLRETEENNLTEPPALLVGTPGRIADHIRRGNITVDTITTLVLDEFDKSLEAGFTEEISFIIGSLTRLKKRVLTSATEALEIPGFVGLSNATRLDFLEGQDAAEKSLAIKKVASPGKDKLETLFHLLCFIGARPSIIFCNHRDAVERVSAYLTGQSIANEFYHGSMEQQQRDSALCKFRNGTVNFLVTTDLAARGLDIPFIRYIIHYHLPHTEDSFTHRNGRTARMDASGTAILILNDEEMLPAYVDRGAEELHVADANELPERPKWSTLFIAAGRKDKVNKVDIVGFLTNKAALKKEDIGLIEVKDFFSFVAIRKTRMGPALQLIKNEKIKNKKVKIDIAK